MLNTTTAWKRLGKLHKAIRDGNMGSDSVHFVVGKSDELEFSKSSSLQTWALGYELPETVTLFTKTTLFFITSEKKAAFLKDLTKENPDAKFQVKILTRMKKAEQSATDALFQQLISAMKAEGGKVGFPQKDKVSKDDPFAQSWVDAVKASGIESVDVSDNLSRILAPKEDEEVKLLKAAADVSTALLQKVAKKQILDIIDSEKKITHEDLATQIEELMEKPEVVKARLKLADGVETEQISMCYTPLIQSGGKFKLKISAQSDKNPVKSGPVVCSLGARYRSYCSNVARTWLVGPTAAQEKDYKFLLECCRVAYKSLKPGAKCSDVYGAVKSYINENRPDLADKLTKNLGFGTGIEFRDSTFLISEENKNTIENNSTFNLSIGFEGMVEKDKDGKEQAYAVLIADTVIVKADGATVLTTAKSEYKDISFEFKEEDEEEGDADTNAVLQVAKIGDERQQRQKETTEEKRRNHQRELAEQASREALERLENGLNKNPVEKKKSETTAYKKASDMPGDETRKLKIFIDKKYEAVVLPIFGIATPFHISTIKNISFNDDDKDQVYLRINFATPTQTSIRNKETGKEATIYLKEITYTSQSFEGLSNANRLIKELQKRFKEREKERAELEDLVEQAELVINKKQPAALTDLYIRPQLEGARTKRIQGTLEAHINGFRYKSRRNDVVDILYSNIKHAFYQPCKNEIMILIHFHLKHAILIGKKKHKDIQVYMEVGEVSFDLDKGRSNYDRDELEAEQRERKNRAKWTKLFEAFMKRVEEMTQNTDYPVEFDQLCYEIGFNGVPMKQSVYLQPTTSSCLVNLSDWPPFVLDLSEIERAHFERVNFMLKNFDIAFVFKDYKRPVAHVFAVPMKSLDHIKEWLDSCDIVYSEGPMSLDWKSIMKTINEDVQGFFEAVGWEQMLGTDQGLSDEEEDEDESEYAPSGSSDEESSDEDYSSEYSEDMSEDEDSEEDDDEGEEEEGLSWDELEAKAANEDKQNQQDWDKEEDARAHKAAQKRKSNKEVSKPAPKKKK